MAKYQIRFMHDAHKESASNDVTLVFGETDAVTVARKCFEMGRCGYYEHMKIIKWEGRNNKYREY